MPISTFPRHDDYDEDEYLLKPGRLRDTRSEGKVISAVIYGNYLTFAYKNLNSNSQVIVGTPNGGSYTQDEYATSMNGSSEITPAVAVYGSTYYMLYTAPATDHHLWTSHN